VTPHEPWSFSEARRLTVAAKVALGEFLPDQPVEGLDIEANARDARLVGDAALFDKVVAEAGARGDFWRRIDWFEQIADQARKERDMSLFSSAATSIRCAAEAEFLRREEGGHFNP
jgi:hypothetical protein